MTWSAREGVAGVALLAMYADAMIGGEEDDELRDRLRAHPLFDGATDHELGETLSRVERASRKASVTALVAELAAAIPTSERASAFLIAAEIVSADEDLAPEENSYLQGLRKALGLSDAQVKSALAQLRG